MSCSIHNEGEAVISDNLRNAEIGSPAIQSYNLGKRMIWSYDY
jgi:hypothetical protein